MSRKSRLLTPLARIRTTAGITQRELAVAAGVSLSCVQFIESGRNLPHRTTIERFRKVLGFDVQRVGDRDVICETANGEPYTAKAFASIQEPLVSRDKERAPLHDSTLLLVSELSSASKSAPADCQRLMLDAVVAITTLLRRDQ